MGFYVSPNGGLNYVRFRVWANTGFKVLNTQYRYSNKIVLNTQYFNIFQHFKSIENTTINTNTQYLQFFKKTLLLQLSTNIVSFLLLEIIKNLWNWNKQQLQSKTKLFFTWFWLLSKENIEKTKIKLFKSIGYWILKYLV